jgi:hypothetical protein
MLPGFSGRLVSEQFLEGELSLLAREPTLSRSRERLGRWRRSSAWLGPASGVQTLFDAAAAPLVEALGFDTPTGLEQVHECRVASIRSAPASIVLLVAPWAERLDRFWRIAVTESVRREADWAILFNGTDLRVLDTARPYARRCLEFDIDLTIDDDRTFVAFWLLLHASAFCPGATDDQPRLRALVARSERFASGVSRSLRHGVLSASSDVLSALLGPARPIRMRASIHDAFEQALTIVYRLLFLLFAEARSLVPLWHPVYRDSYSVSSLSAVAQHPSASVVGLWDALRAIARLAHAGCRAGDLRVTPFNGRLFAPAATPLADRRDLDDEAARRAVLALSTRASSDGAGREPIAYRDLGVEQLGAVYETLLDYEPYVDHHARDPGKNRRPSVSLVRGSGVRKATGSFYTPQPIADYLVRRALGPLVQNAAPEQVLRLRVVDPAMGSGAFLVAACRYLADAYEAALVRAGGCTAADFGERERIAIRRAIAERCLYGVDVNPMAVQLGRLSLWLATLAADRPLTFLDHHLRVGDSLIGAWVANVRMAPNVKPARTPRDLTLPLFDEASLVQMVKATLPVRISLEELPGDTIDGVRAKERALSALDSQHTQLSKWKRVADLWCAPWFAAAEGDVPASAFRALSDDVLGRGRVLPPTVVTKYLDAAETIRGSHRLFHWELEFPEVFFDADGHRRPDAGFDVVIGNPPWDMIRADSGEEAERVRAKRAVASLIRFTRDSGVYTAQSDGHANRYQLFLERSIALTKIGGRMAMVLPSGLATDHGSSALRRQLLTTCDVDALVGFDNQQGVFPIHRSVKFLLLSASRGSATRTIACRLGERDPTALEHIGDESPDTSPAFGVRITPALLERLSGESLVIPDLRSALDVAILERAATLFPPLGSQAGWRARFGRELNATDDREHFGSPGHGLPIVEGKHIEPFRADLGAVRFTLGLRKAERLLEHQPYTRNRLAYRDVAGATNRLTLIAAILPAGCVSTHTLFCLRTRLSRQEQDYLCGLFNSFIVNYFVRLRVTTHVTTSVVEALPIPPKHYRPGAFRTIGAIARLLARRDDRSAFARLQALVAEVYQLSREEFEHVLGTFPLVPKEVREEALAELRASET